MPQTAAPERLQSLFPRAATRGKRRLARSEEAQGVLVDDGDDLWVLEGNQAVALEAVETAADCLKGQSQPTAQEHPDQAG
ncbi:hypothetical protein D9M69_721430 [compost metagenome]